MTGLRDEWSDRVDIVRRALAILADETEGWAGASAATADSLSPGADRTEEDDR